MGKIGSLRALLMYSIERHCGRYTSNAIVVATRLERLGVFEDSLFYVAT